jgi:hypothetical protein
MPRSWNKLEIVSPAASNYTLVCIKAFTTTKFHKILAG